MKKNRIKPRWFLKTLLLLTVSFTFSLLHAQNIELSGKVTNQEGETLPGVTIIVKGTTIGTVTNPNGEFSLSIPIDAEILQFSFVGMKSHERR
jgi:hypothetical protein